MGQSMRIAKGIKGIRGYIKEDRKGWHLFIDDSYVTYLDETLLQVRTNYRGYTLTEICGNNVFFAAK